MHVIRLPFLLEKHFLELTPKGNGCHQQRTNKGRNENLCDDPPKLRARI